MTTAYWCVLIAAILPYVWTIVAKVSKPRFNNKRPRIFLDGLSGWGQRADWSQMNSFEAFPAFAAAVIIASHIGNIDSGLLDTLAMSFIACRVLHGIFYITDKHVLRSLVWFTSVSIWISMFVLSS